MKFTTNMETLEKRVMVMTRSNNRADTKEAPGTHNNTCLPFNKPANLNVSVVSATYKVAIYVFEIDVGDNGAAWIMYSKKDISFKEIPAENGYTTLLWWARTVITLLERKGG